jgi:hypothetical protein
LLSEELKATLKDDYGIRVISAAPKHQHQNGTPERRWQTSRQVAFKLMTHARVGLPFFDTALQQAALICNVVPVRGAFRPGTAIEEGRVVVDALHTNSSGDRGDVSIPSVTTPHIYDSNDDDFVANDDVPSPKRGLQQNLKRGPPSGPQQNFKRGPLLPLNLLIPTGTRTVPSKKLMPTLYS